MVGRGVSSALKNKLSGDGDCLLAVGVFCKWPGSGVWLGLQKNKSNGIVLTGSMTPIFFTFDLSRMASIFF